jgi:hypothetical protein
MIWLLLDGGQAKLKVPEGLTLTIGTVTVTGTRMATGTTPVLPVPVAVTLM